MVQGRIGAPALLFRRCAGEKSLVEVENRKTDRQPRSGEWVYEKTNCPLAGVDKIGMVRGTIGAPALCSDGVRKKIDGRGGK